MKRKDYEKPTMQVVKLQHQTHLLAGSGEETQQAQREDYESLEWEW